MTRDVSTSTILIVDDNPTNLGVLFEYLRGIGYKVLVAENGESALQRAVRAHPDIILLDVLMPGIDGFETCRRLKNMEETKDIPIILMTALTETVDKVRGFTSGAVDYITKPAQYEEVSARIATHLNLRYLQKDLQQQLQEREILIEELDAYAHTVAHDLKSPLAHILGFTELLLEDYQAFPKEKTEHILNTIIRSSHKMQAIIDGLLLLASVRMEDVAIEPLDMEQIALEAIARLYHMIEEYEVDIDVMNNWPTAVGHAPWIEEVWVNYLSNAIKYGGQPPYIKLGGDKQKNGQSRYWVQDNGRGLTSEEQAQMFIPFSRIEQSTTIEGHGLGLSIVQRIVIKLGGHVGVNSKIGQGSTFFFTLPPVDEINH